MKELIEGWTHNRMKLSRAENAAEYIPTWQIGSDQSNPNPTLKYAKDGYSKNSLIYSCIKEKATSFAALEPMIVRRDGAPLKQHRMLDLLRDPNEHQDGQAFAELLATQFEAAGNVYIHKARGPRKGFEGFPVTSLELLRPDYVTIEPGRTVEQDVFCVTVGGEERARLLRRDVIHIMEPNLMNDFYGMSKIAVLATEGDVDSEMTSYESAFFRNAGVPMGILKVKGKTNPDETTEIKGRFRQAFNGFKNWFNVLVLNMDESEYVPLGLKQSDMEMDSTRFHSESRICSVFGVPGVIVGARYAMQGNALGVEEAEHQFWAETMVPDTMRKARAFQKYLLPEFATTRDRGAIVTYDFSQVRALQEDRSRKLREVVRLVLTGGFTINEALEAVGLPKQANGDFYIRNGNQVIVEMGGTITPMSDGGGKNPNNPLEGAAQWERQVEGILREAGA